MNIRSKDLNASYHTGLWESVQSDYEAERWSELASNTARYVENYFRVLLGNPHENGKPLTAGPLLNRALSDPYFPPTGHGGKVAGWRNLASGFVSGVGNTDRHQIQDRPDIKPYAIGVLGLGSLLLTQFEQNNPMIGRPSIGFNLGDPTIPPHSNLWKEEANKPWGAY